MGGIPDLGMITAWYPTVTAKDLPPTMLRGDPRLCCPGDYNDTVIARGRGGCVYKYSDTLAYKVRSSRREIMFMKRAKHVTVPVVCAIEWPKSTLGFDRD